MTKKRPVVPNSVLLQDNNDPTQTLNLTISLEEEVEKIIDDATNKIIEIYGKLSKSERERLVLMSSLDLTELDAELLAIESSLTNGLGRIMEEAITNGYRNGRSRASQRINIMMQGQAATNVALDERDRKLIQQLRDTNLSRVVSLSSRHIAEARAIIAEGIVNCTVS